MALGNNRWAHHTHCAASACGEPLVEGATGDRQPVIFGASRYHRVCARRHRAWLAKRRDRIAQEERESA